MTQFGLDTGIVSKICESEGNQHTCRIWTGNSDFVRSDQSWIAFYRQSVVGQPTQLLPRTCAEIRLNQNPLSTK